MPGKVYVATTTFATDVDGVPIVVHKDRDRVREGHPLLASNPQNFREVEEGVTYDVEDATADPGTTRASRARRAPTDKES